jgi:hypothetical protein
MDLNLYNVHFVVGLFGEPMLVSYHPNLYRNGIDTSGILLLEYPDFICQCTGAKDCAAPGSVQLIGDAGRIRAAATARSSVSSVPDRKIFAASTASRRGSTRWRRSP